MDSTETGVVSSSTPVIIPTDTASGLECHSFAGVNRILNLEPYFLVDNIGRNIEVWRFEKDGIEPSERRWYDRTSCPREIPSLLDVDLHAAFLRGGGHELLTVDHYGRLWHFALRPSAVQMRPTCEMQLLGDVERFVMANDCFIGSSPRGHATDDAAQPGIFLFAPLPRSLPTASGVTRLACDQALADWGAITALGVSASATRLAVGAGTRLGVFALHASDTGVKIGPCAWEANVAFESQWLHIGDDALWAGGFRPSPSAESGDWNACRGGSIEVFAIDSGARTRAIDLPEETAWGYGADPVVLAPDYRRAYVLGCDASLHVVDIRKRVTRQLYASPLGREEGDLSLGIGHADLRDKWLYAGFSRGGFRLFRYDLDQD
ncbi:MAG: hypothetical protein HOP16_06970 [Acidobacteria bacterium]|nr:hypothetical protein [Acidobacteriota bacterium]